MKVFLQLEKGYLPDKYGKFAADSEKYKEKPIVSPPIEISEIPKNAKFLALSLIDYDAIPVCGFPWIHWTVANLPVTSDRLEIPENSSQTWPVDIVQGRNSNASRFVGETDEKVIQRYTGPTPPDQDHVYTLVISALSEQLDLQAGFWWNELLKKSASVIVEQVSTTFLGRSK